MIFRQFANLERFIRVIEENYVIYFFRTLKFKFLAVPFNMKITTNNDHDLRMKLKSLNTVITNNS